LKFLESIQTGLIIGDWEYMGKTEKAFGTPGGSWQGMNGFKFKNSNNNEEFILRSIPESKSFFVLESYQIPGQLYNMKLSDSKVYKIEDGKGKLFESYNLTAGLGRVKKNVVKEIFDRLGYSNNLICEIEDTNTDWKGLTKSLLDWAPIREKVKNKIKEEKNVIKNPVVTSEIKPNESKSNIISQNMPLNQILFGPPGTGKTYHTIDTALEIINDVDVKGLDWSKRKEVKDLFDKKLEEGQIAFITFHQSLSYEDFIEGIKPLEPNSELNKTNQLTYKVIPGIFKKLCSKANASKTIVAEIDKDEIELNPEILSTAYNAYAEQLPNQDEETSQYVLKTKADNKAFYLFKNSSGSIVVKAGTMKTKMPIAFSEIESVLIRDKEPAYKSYTPVIIDEILKSGGFGVKKLKNPSKNYILIIDEINRGNVSQIFGELITLIEEDKRLGKDEALKVTLPYSKDKFGVPQNLYIIGTMNTADRSVEALDTALRRRFSFTEMPPLYDLKELDYPFAGTTGKDILKTINKRIEKLLDRDQLIGHSYFLLGENENAQEKLINSFYRNIIPLLQEYFFGDYAKIGAVLGKGFVRKEEDEDDIDFADGFDQEDFNEKEVYQIIDYRENQPGNEYIEKGMSFEKAIKMLINKTSPVESES
jgi:5-methylcytosine-specific restriction protein B